MHSGRTPYQLALTRLIAIVGIFSSGRAHSQTAALGAKASFVLGTAFIIFSEKGWWPVTFSLFALVTWVLSGWVVASLGYWLAARIRRL
jgi:hypothetical protein